MLSTRTAKIKFLVLLLSIFFLLACTLGGMTTTNQPSFDATKVALEFEATQMALQLTQAALQQAPTAAPLQPTLAAPTAPPPTAAPAAQTTATTAPTSNMPDFDTWMKSASILLYEDIAADFDVYRYIPIALNGMGLKYVDEKDYLGHFKNQLLTQGPNGKGWDLIISAKELHTDLQGEFYVYLNDALNQGSSVIIEEWAMDQIGGGKLSLLTGRCGVEFSRNWIEQDINDTVIYALNGSHRAHHHPNEGLSLTKVTGYWLGDDMGDRMRLAPGSAATPLWGLYANSPSDDIVSVSCVEDRMIIHTSCSHNYAQDRMVPVWQNYIYSTLRARYDYLASQ